MSLISDKIVRPRCFIMLLISGFFAALNIVAYLITIGKIQPISLLPTINYFDGITRFIEIFKDFKTVVENVKTDWLYTFYYLAPIFLLIFSVLSAVKDLIRLLRGKYGRLSNVISKAFICAAVLLMTCFGMFIDLGNGVTPNFGVYFKALASGDQLVFAAVLIALIGVVLAALFMILPFRTAKSKSNE